MVPLTQARRIYARGNTYHNNLAIVSLLRPKLVYSQGQTSLQSYNPTKARTYFITSLIEKVQYTQQVTNLIFSKGNISLIIAADILREYILKNESVDNVIIKHSLDNERNSVYEVKILSRTNDKEFASIEYVGFSSDLFAALMQAYSMLVMEE